MGSDLEASTLYFNIANFALRTSSLRFRVPGLELNPWCPNSVACSAAKRGGNQDSRQPHKIYTSDPPESFGELYRDDLLVIKGL